MSKTLRILHIEDNDDDAMSLKRHLESEGYMLVYLRVTNAEQLNNALSESIWDVIISEYNLKNICGPDALRIVKNLNVDIPFILLSSAVGEANAVTMMKSGAHDYVMKDNLLRIAPAIEREIADQQIRRERRKATSQLAESERRFQEMVNLLPQIVFELDDKGFFKIVNRAALEITGYTDDDIQKGLNVFHVIAPSEHPRLLHNFNAIINGETISGNDYVMVRKDGSRFPATIYSTPIVHDNICTGIRGIVIDITERKKFEETLSQTQIDLQTQNEAFQALNAELVKAKNKAEESDRLKSAFLANMSHEIRTPMNAIIGFCELLRESDLAPDKFDMYLNIINSNSHQLLAIITDIIDISKIEAGQIAIDNKEIVIASVCNELYNIFNAQASRKNIQFYKKYDENSPISFVCDEGKLKQVITNLLGNAFKFTSEGSVTLGFEIFDEDILFSISDTGIGIEPIHHGIIFERFRQVETGSSRQYGGTGLGLSITKALVELLGGKIWLDSNISKGSCFFFKLPLIKSNQSYAQKVTNTQNSKYQWNKYSILIAEDEDDNFTLLNEILTPTQITIYHAQNGIEAVNIFKQHCDLSLILMDIKMPEMNGYEATRIIKSISAQTPIIALTAYAMSEDHNKSINAGCNDYITKPFNRRLFLEKVSYYLNQL